MSPNGIEDALNFYFGSESTITVKVESVHQQCLCGNTGIIRCDGIAINCPTCNPSIISTDG